MGDSVTESLILDLLEFVANGGRSYEEVMDAWRTSCPRLPVWEEANDRGLVAQGEVLVRSVNVHGDAELGEAAIARAWSDSCCRKVLASEGVLVRGALLGCLHDLLLGLIVHLRADCSS